MSEETVVKQCAPTLAGIKNGSLFTCPCEDREELQRQVRAWNRRFVSRGLCLIPLKYEKGRVLLYLYRPEGLRKDLEDDLARKVLEAEGYPWAAPERCVARLARKLNSSSSFPHEIGLFLSYPPEDVKGFIENRAENYKYSGIWKVYGDVEKAQRMFRRFKKCTETYWQRWNAGSCMEELTVKI